MKKPIIFISLPDALTNGNHLLSSVMPTLISFVSANLRLRFLDSTNDLKEPKDFSTLLREMKDFLESQEIPVSNYLPGEAFDPEKAWVIGNSAFARSWAHSLGVSYRTPEWKNLREEILSATTTRKAKSKRKTRETDIEVSVNLDRIEPVHANTGLGFFDHMLEQLGSHGGFSLNIQVTGDLHIDEHHTIEDTAIALGEALRAALGEKRGIQRYGFLLPMDEAQAQASIDLAGRAVLFFQGKFPREEVGGFPTEMVEHFFKSLSDSLGATLHIEVRGKNTHHMIEACFKAVGRAFRQAIARDGSHHLPSTKGML